MEEKANKIIRIIIADDHQIFRDGFSILLNKIPGVKLIAEAENGDELIKYARKLHPDLIITDIKMPVLNGIEATRVLSKELPATTIFALSMYDQTCLIEEMMGAGAKGYLLKNASKQEIIRAVKSVSTGDYNSFPVKNIPLFSPTEVAIIKLICREYSKKKIAKQLALNIKAVDEHRKKILLKIGVKNTAGIVVYALKNNIYK